MLQILFRLFKSDRGAMDRVLVTLLFVVIAVAALVSIEQWSSNQKENLVNQSNTVINSVLNE